MQNNDKIDFVVMWVDGSDPEWLKEKQKYDVSRNSDGSVYRYRDWDLLKYWFRGIEKFAPWVNNVYFITWGHLPDWLNTNHPKLKIINHKDYIPKKYLPTFSANTIELNIHRIKGLSNNFVLFNDDLYLLKDVKPTDFFKNNVPIDTVALNVHCPIMGNANQYLAINDVAIINKYFNFKKSIKDNKFKWFNLKNGKQLLRTFALYSCPRFPGFWQHHLCSSYNKKSFEKVWEKEYDYLDATCMNKFRNYNDVNQWLIKEWQIADGNFEVRSSKFGKSFHIDKDGIDNIKEKMIDYIRYQKGKVISINDGPMSEEEFDNIKKELTKSFNYILKDKCSYEK